MKQILNAIVIIAFTLFIGCLAVPTNLETLNNYLHFENSTQQATLSKNEEDNLINTNKTETQEFALNKLNNTHETPVMQIKVLEMPTEVKTDDKDQLKIEQTDKFMSNDKNINKTEEDNKFKDVPKDEAAGEITKQSEVWKDLEDDFSLLQGHMPDLTEEEIKEHNKEDAIPWNFLKSLDVKRNINGHKSKELPLQIPIYITVPLVINSHSTLPLSVIIGGENVSLKVRGDFKDDIVHVPIPANHIKDVDNASMVTPTSSYNKLMDYDEPPPRQTNRHRSNIRTKIYARNNNHQLQEFEYKPNSELLKNP